MGDDVRDAIAEPTAGFPTDTGGLLQAVRVEAVELGNGDEFDLRIAPVAKELAGSTVRMLAYNGSIPGPTLTVPQGAEVTAAQLCAFATPRRGASCSKGRIRQRWRVHPGDPQ